MTVRDRVGRTRYIGFVVESGQRVGRDELSRALSESARMLGGDFSYQLTAFEGGRGILRVPHRLKLDSILMLTSIRAVGRDRAPVRIRTVVTSGTICTVKERLGIAPSKRQPREARREPHGRGL